MRKTFKNVKKSWRVSTLKKTTALIALITSSLALTACGSEDTPEEKLKNELNNVKEIELLRVNMLITFSI